MPEGGWERKECNVLNHERWDADSLDFQASVSVLLSSTIFSPGLNAGIPMYGQLEHRNASPR